jgi:hypothetical protein
MMTAAELGRIRMSLPLMLLVSEMLKDWETLKDCGGALVNVGILTLSAE